MGEFKMDRLWVRVYENKYKLGQIAAEMAETYICQAIEQRGEAVIILATGTSQFEFLKYFINRTIEWKKVIVFHLDEYVGIPATHPASFRRYLRERVLNKVGIGTCYLINGNSEDLEIEKNRLEALLNQYVVDVAFVGIGENGHLAFNDPPADFEDRERYKIVELDEACKRQQVGEGWFLTPEEVPDFAISMTIPAILDSRIILCLAPEKRKAEAVRRMLTDKISPEIPASILRKHSQTTLFLDRYSASLIPEKF